MKKFSKLLALSLATALTLGMTVSAAGSTSTTNSEITSEVLADNAKKVDADATGLDAGVTVEVKAATVADYDAASNVADDVAPSDVEVVEVVTVFNVELENAAGADASATVSASNPLTVTLKNVPGVVSGKLYVVLHQKKDGTWERVSGVQPGPTLTATFTSLSPVAVVEVDEKDTGNDDDDDDDDDDDTTAAASTSVAATTGVAASPKTGETMPVAVLFAVASLGAAVVCSRKARYNK